jgi:hypothetical protein
VRCAWRLWFRKPVEVKGLKALLFKKKKPKPIKPLKKTVKK